MVSEIIPVFARKPIFGYKAVAISTIGIAFFSMLVWAHHMFAVGMPIGLDAFFMITSMVIAVPTGVKIFNWLATAWRGNIDFDTPMLFSLGFIALFTMGGLSGIFLAAFPVDWQVTDTYYVVAHLHYVLFGGSIFGIFAGLDAGSSPSRCPRSPPGNVEIVSVAREAGHRSKIAVRSTVAGPRREGRVHRARWARGCAA